MEINQGEERRRWMKKRDGVAELREVIAGARDSLHRTNSDDS
jgi:hypothetical protein